MINKVVQRIGEKDLIGRLKSLPNLLPIGDMFSGAGTFDKVVKVVFDTFARMFPNVMKDKDAFWQQLKAHNYYPWERTILCYVGCCCL